MSSSPAIIHTLLSQRRSPYAFDPDRDVAQRDVQALFEAARWSASSYNEQPWRYIVGVKSRHPAVWERIHAVLVEGNQGWTAQVPVLALGIIRRDFSHNGKPNKVAAHDLGAASASLTVEASARGLHVHQMGGLEPQRAHQEFALDANFEVFTALAIGYAMPADRVPEAYAAREAAPRTRKPLNELILAGGF